MMFYTTIVELDAVMSGLRQREAPPREAPETRAEREMDKRTAVAADSS